MNRFVLFLVVGCAINLVAVPGRADKPTTVPHWNVDDVKPGMSGHGVTVLKGTKTERFAFTVLGIVKNYNPGQDVVLVRLGGLGLENTGVISGMSGSPVYVGDKLLGAIAYTWPFNTEPVGGVTPFAQMVEYALPRKRAGGIAQVAEFTLDGPVLAAEREPIDAGSLALPEALAIEVGTPRLVRIQTPIVTSGLSPAAREELNRLLEPTGIFAAEGGAATAKVLQENSATRFEPGSAMAVGLVTGDVSMAAIGTVTAVDGERIYGFGHPFFGNGPCEMPLLSAFIHAVIPRQTISAKMGSPLLAAGTIDVDSSTCVAGRLGKAPDLVPVAVRFRNQSSSFDRTFRCQIIRDQTMLGPLAMTALASFGTLEGQTPNEFAARVTSAVEFEGYPPLVLENLYSGPQFVGGRGLLRAFVPISNLLTILSSNAFHRPRIVRVECSTDLVEQRRSAEIVGAVVKTPVLEPGETLVVEAIVRQHQLESNFGPAGDQKVRIPIQLKLPDSMRPGRYTATIGDAMSDFRNELIVRRHLAAPTTFAQLYELLKLQSKLRYTDIVLRINGTEPGLAIDGSELSGLPAVASEILARDTTRSVTPVVGSTSARSRSDWAIDGAQTVQFEIVKQRDFYEFSK